MLTKNSEQINDRLHPTNTPLKGKIKVSEFMGIMWYLNNFSRLIKAKKMNADYDNLQKKLKKLGKIKSNELLNARYHKVTSLYNAIVNKNYLIIKFLLDNKADIEQGRKVINEKVFLDSEQEDVIKKDKFEVEHTPLMLAVMLGYNKAVVTLLKRGANADKEAAVVWPDEKPEKVYTNLPIEIAYQLGRARIFVNLVRYSKCIYNAKSSVAKILHDTVRQLYNGKTIVNLSNVPIGDNGVKILANILKRLEPFPADGIHLELANCQIGKIGVFSLSKLLCDKMRIKTINLQDNPIAAKHAKILFKSLKQNEYIRDLNVAGIKLNDAAVKELKEAFHTSCQQFDSINLSRCGITINDAVSWVKEAKRLKSIKFNFDQEENPKDLIEIYRAIYNNEELFSNLQSLDINFEDFDNQQVSAFDYINKVKGVKLNIENKLLNTDTLINHESFVKNFVTIDTHNEIIQHIDCAKKRHEDIIKPYYRITTGNIRAFRKFYTIQIKSLLGKEKRFLASLSKLSNGTDKIGHILLDEDRMLLVYVKTHDIKLSLGRCPEKINHLIMYNPKKNIILDKEKLHNYNKISRKSTKLNVRYLTKVVCKNFTFTEDNHITTNGDMLLDVTCNIKNAGNLVANSAKIKADDFENTGKFHINYNCFIGAKEQKEKDENFVASNQFTNHGEFIVDGNLAIKTKNYLSAKKIKAGLQTYISANNFIDDGGIDSSILRLNCDNKAILGKQYNVISSFFDGGNITVNKNAKIIGNKLIRIHSEGRLDLRGTIKLVSTDESAKKFKRITSLLPQDLFFDDDFIPRVNLFSETEIFISGTITSHNSVRINAESRIYLTKTSILQFKNTFKCQSRNVSIEGKVDGNEFCVGQDGNKQVDKLILFADSSVQTKQFNAYAKHFDTYGCITADEIKTKNDVCNIYGKITSNDLFECKSKKNFVMGEVYGGKFDIDEAQVLLTFANSLIKVKEFCCQAEEIFVKGKVDSGDLNVKQAAIFKTFVDSVIEAKQAIINANNITLAGEFTSSESVVLKSDSKITISSDAILNCKNLTIIAPEVEIIGTVKTDNLQLKCDKLSVKGEISTKSKLIFEVKGDIYQYKKSSIQSEGYAKITAKNVEQLGTINLQGRGDITVFESYNVKKGAALKAIDTKIEAGKDINLARKSTVTLDNSLLQAKESITQASEIDVIGLSSLQSGNKITFKESSNINGCGALKLTANMADIKGSFKAGGLLCDVKKLDDVKNLLTKSGNYENINPTNLLDVSIKEPKDIDIDQTVDRGCAIGLSASSITVNKKITSKKGLALKSTEGDIVFNASIGAEAITLSSAQDIKLNKGNEIRAQKGLQANAERNIEMKAKLDTSGKEPKYTSAKIIASDKNDGKNYDLCLIANGKIYNGGSEIVNHHGNNYIHTKGGINFDTLHQSYVSDEKTIPKRKRIRIGFVKITITYGYIYYIIISHKVQRPKMMATKGKNYITSEGQNGKVRLCGANILFAKENNIYGEKKLECCNLVVQTIKKEKKARWFRLYKKKCEQRYDSSIGTNIVALDPNSTARFISNGEIHIIHPNIFVGDMYTKAKKTILKNQILNHEIKKSSHNFRLGVGPVSFDGKKISYASNSAAVSVGVNKNYSVTNYQTVAPSTIDCMNFIDESEELFSSEVNTNVKNDMSLNAKDNRFQGNSLHVSQKSTQQAANINIHPDGSLSGDAAICKSTYERIQNTMQRTFIGSNLHLGKNVNNLTLDNSKVITKTISSEGKVNVMLKSKQNIEKSSAKHIGFNFGEKTPGKFNIGYSWHESGSTPEESDLVSEDSKNANLDITRIKDDDDERSGGVSGKLNFSGDIATIMKDAAMNITLKGKYADLFKNAVDLTNTFMNVGKQLSEKSDGKEPSFSETFDKFTKATITIAKATGNKDLQRLGKTLDTMQKVSESLGNIPDLFEDPTIENINKVMRTLSEAEGLGAKFNRRINRTLNFLDIADNVKNELKDFKSLEKDIKTVSDKIGTVSKLIDEKTDSKKIRKIVEVVSKTQNYVETLSKIDLKNDGFNKIVSTLRSNNMLGEKINRAVQDVETFMEAFEEAQKSLDNKKDGVLDRMLKVTAIVEGKANSSKAAKLKKILQGTKSGLKALTKGKKIFDKRFEVFKQLRKVKDLNIQYSDLLSKAKKCLARADAETFDKAVIKGNGFFDQTEKYIRSSKIDKARHVLQSTGNKAKKISDETEKVVDDIKAGIMFLEKADKLREQLVQGIKKNKDLTELIQKGKSIDFDDILKITKKGVAFMRGVFAIRKDLDFQNIDSIKELLCDTRELERLIDNAADEISTKEDETCNDENKKKEIEFRDRLKKLAEMTKIIAQATNNKSLHKGEKILQSVESSLKSLENVSVFMKNRSEENFRKIIGPLNKAKILGDDLNKVVNQSLQTMNIVSSVQEELIKFNKLSDNNKTILNKISLIAKVVNEKSSSTKAEKMVNLLQNVQSDLTVLKNVTSIVDKCKSERKFGLDNAEQIIKKIKLIKLSGKFDAAAIQAADFLEVIQDVNKILDKKQMKALDKMCKVTDVIEKKTNNDQARQLKKLLENANGGLKAVSKTKKLLDKISSKFKDGIRSFFDAKKIVRQYDSFISKAKDKILTGEVDASKLLQQAKHLEGKLTEKIKSVKFLSKDVKTVGLQLSNLSGFLKPIEDGLGFIDGVISMSKELDTKAVYLITNTLRGSESIKKDLAAFMEGGIQSMKKFKFVQDKVNVLVDKLKYKAEIQGKKILVDEIQKFVETDENVFGKMLEDEKFTEFMQKNILNKKVICDFAHLLKKCAKLDDNDKFAMDIEKLMNGDMSETILVKSTNDEIKENQSKFFNNNGKSNIPTDRQNNFNPTKSI